jgi:hypothetical protein
MQPGEHCAHAHIDERSADGYAAAVKEAAGLLESLENLLWKGEIFAARAHHLGMEHSSIHTTEYTKLK